MKQFFTYLALQCKRALRFLPFITSLTLLTCLGIGLIGGAAIQSDNNAESNQKLSVAIVGDTDGDYARFGLNAIKAFDSSRFTVELLELEEKEAREKLDRNEIIAYVVIPENFIDRAIRGDVQSVTYVSSGHAVGIANVFKQEISTLIARIVLDSQKGTYGLQGLLRSHHISGIGTHVNAISIRYFSTILNRNMIIQEEVIGVSDSLSFAGYITSGLLVLLFLLMGISCCPMFAKKDLSMERLLCVAGQKPFLHAIGEYLVYFLTLAVNVAILSVTLAFFGEKLFSFIPELAGITSAEIWLLALKLMPPLLTVAALQFLLYELSSGIVNGVLLQFLSAITLGYISGCFYPIGFLPETIQTLSGFTPSGIARRYISAVISARSVGTDLFALLGFLVCFLIATALIREYRVRRL